MKVIGVIAEYDPFHLGHGYHMEQTRRVFGEDSPVVCVMSGNWTQRGQAAVADKWTRAKAALCGGADLILELPSPWATASAETFARGGVELLAMTGVVDVLSFGSECGDLSLLTEGARVLDSGAYALRLRTELDKGRGYAAARAAAAGISCLEKPNDNLGVEYLRALKRCGSGMEPFCVSRKGDGHNEALTGTGFASASAIRELHRRGDPAVWEHLPRGSREIFDGEWAELGHAFSGILARLRTMPPEELARVPDCGEGLEHRILRAAGGARTLEELYDLAKSRRYAHARIRRVVLRAFLGIDSIPERPPYLRVLGMTRRGRELLRAMRGLPVITKPAHGKGEPLLEAEARCTDLYALCFSRPRPAGMEWLKSPVIL